MERVEPIKSEKKIQDLKDYLLKSGNTRNYTLIVLGLNTALRISDLLNLKWEDVYNFETKQFKTHVLIKDKDTGKHRRFRLNQNVLRSLEKFRNEVKYFNPIYIFESRQGKNRAITRHMAIRIIKEACAAVGIKENVSCNTLRKTFGYHSWKKGVHLAVLMELYSHPNHNVTKQYLGILQDDFHESYSFVEL